MVNPVAVKLCGVKTTKAALWAGQSGAAFVGIVFHPASKRFVSPEKALALSKVIRQTESCPVAVVTTHAPDAIHAICNDNQIDTVQLHSPFARAQGVVLAENIKRIYALNIEEILDFRQHCPGFQRERDYLLVDAAKPGQGTDQHLKRLTRLPSDGRVLIAGGLNANNVCGHIQRLNPFGVDVSTGVENEQGEKSKPQIQAFMQAVYQPALEAQ